MRVPLRLLVLLVGCRGRVERPVAGEGFDGHCEVLTVAGVIAL